VDAPLAFRIGGSNRAHVIVSPSRREWPGATDYWDGNWVYATVTVVAGLFRGSFEAQLRAEEFLRFRDQLRPLYEKLTGRAVFDPMEPWLRIEVEGDGKGHFHASCKADDQPGIGNKLAFGIDFDQTELPVILKGLDAICEAFPVVGVAGRERSSLSTDYSARRNACPRDAASSRAYRVVHTSSAVGPNERRTEQGMHSLDHVCDSGGRQVQPVGCRARRREDASQIPLRDQRDVQLVGEIALDAPELAAHRKQWKLEHD
jgi:hypothetical protein